MGSGLKRCVLPVIRTEVSLKKLLGKYGYLLGVAAIIIFFDQLTKALVRTNIPFGEMWSPWEWLTPYARIFHWTNTGAAFGMLQGFGDLFRILAIIVALAILYYFPQVPKEEWPLRLAMGLQFGGAVGNLIDRFTLGHVTDWISVFNFAVFNIADASITMGVVALILGVCIKEWQHKQTHPRDDSSVQISAPTPDTPASSEPGTLERESTSQTVTGATGTNGNRRDQESFQIKRAFTQDDGKTSSSTTHAGDNRGE
ncbi:MAG: signal peptidase II [Chloroflexi bacterium]|nr:MAG: signal peptidase II [Chloroflexota bacterium]